MQDAAVQDHSRRSDDEFVDTSTSINFDFRRRPSLPASARRFLGELYGELIVNPDDTFRMTMAAHELLENLVKYSSSASGSLELAIREGADGATMTIRTRNRATPARIEELRGTINRISTAPDPIALYDDFIRESAERSQGSGLGLARIRAEGNMELGWSVLGDEITIIARGPVQIRK